MLGPKVLLIVAPAMTGQASKSPGDAGPARPQAAIPTVGHARVWVEAVNQVDGKAYLISAWREGDGSIKFDPREYPQFVVKPAPTPAPAPEPAPPAGPATPGPKPNWPYPQLGVVKEKVPRPVAGQAWYGGNAVRSIEAATAGDTPRSKPPDVHLTVIGDEAEQAHARDQLDADPRFRALSASMGDRLAVQFYGPTDPMVARVGLVDGGKPDVGSRTRPVRSGGGSTPTPAPGRSSPRSARRTRATAPAATTRRAP